MMENAINANVRLLVEGLDALATRVDMADNAVKSLELQYYLWENDASGYYLAQKVLAAAERGVSVRVLLDDIDTDGLDQAIRSFDAHPNIEVRLFNPFHRWVPRLLDGLTRFSELNRRMHNKAMVMDGKVCVVGGRNIGNGYFGLGGRMDFEDIDILAVGDVALEVAANFDRYWQCKLAVPAAEVLRDIKFTGNVPSLEALQMIAEPATRKVEAWKKENGLTSSLLCTLYPATVEVISDAPEKSWGRNKHKKGVATKLGQAIDETNNEVVILSPYFVPRRGVFKMIRKLCNRKVRVKILTNSLASNDVIVVHAGYAPKRRALLLAGAKLFEHLPDPSRLRKSGKAKIGLSPSSGQSSLHAKLFVIDQSRCFIGSFNFDPRSARLNTEMGLMVDCPVVAGHAAEFAENLMETAYHVSLLDRTSRRPKILWKDPDGATYHKDPHSGFWSRILVRLLALFPIQAQL